MKMQIMRCPESGNINRIFDLESVECIELSLCGKELHVMLKSGHSFIACELSSHSNTTPELMMDSFKDAFEKIEKRGKDV